MITLSHTEKVLVTAEIEEVENIVGLDFPKEYREHLLLFNGGKCSPNIFSFIENGKQTESSVDWFLAIYEGDYDNLKGYIYMYKVDSKRLPFHMLPIAHDPGGNLICISCNHDDKGYIYFWDHENEVDYSTSNDSDYSNLFLIAKSLKDFLEKLKTDSN